MSLSSTLRKLNKSSALATVFCSIAATAVWAAPSGGPLALSSDGSTVLDSKYDTTLNTDTFWLTDTATGARTTLSAPNGYQSFLVTGLSANGKTVLGSYGNSGDYVAFVWTAADGYVPLGSLGGTSTIAEAISADGNAATGYGRVDTSSTFVQAFYWTKSGSIQALGTFGGDSSYGWNISADGRTVVGEADRLDGTSHAFVSTSGGSLQDIDTLFTENSSARLVSDNGSVVAGTGYSSTSSISSFRWTAVGGMINIGDIGGAATYAQAMSGDGTVLVGQGETASGDDHAFRYVATSPTTGMITDLGTLGGTTSSAAGVSTNGTIVVGTATDLSAISHGFRWTEATGMQTVEEWLTSEGVNLGTAATRNATLVSADGNVVIGQTVDNTTYIARVAGPDEIGGTGIIDTSKFLPTVASANNVAVQYGVYSADTIMFGAQGEPMRNLLSTGQKSVWGTIDGGYDDSHVSKGGLGLGEFGFGYGIADGVTARFAGGGTYTKQDLDVGGDVRQRGFYLSPEVSADLGRNVYLTVGGYWGRGSIDSHRGYLNGADRDYSDGSTNSETWAAKIRLDWLNAATVNNTAITPYTALSFAHTKVDGFTENNGSFPVSYDATDDHATIARIGADFVHPLTDKVRLLAKAEADYQFEDHAAGTSGSILGVSDFNLDGQDLKHFWLRGGLGAEFDVGKASTASVMVNATTQGQDPNVWVRTNFTVKF